AGTQDTGSVTLEDPRLLVTELPGPETSVFFRQYILDSINVLNDLLLLDFSYKPKVSLYADGGFNSTLSYRPYKNFGSSFGVNLTVPIYDGKKKKLQHEKMGFSLQTTKNYRDFARSQYYQQILQLKQQYLATERLIAEIKTQIKYSESLIDVNSRLLETGDAKIADLIIALNNYLTAKNLLTQNTVSRLQIVNQINYWNR
ncbi:MAG TPA: TolC family protein, partial [Flavitalea sp.]|nr:TolC family protein [Flavitalea sp.]